MGIAESDQVVGRLPRGISREDLPGLVKKVSAVTVLRTLWYPEVIDELERTACEFLNNAGIDQSKIITRTVPGAFELPLAALQEARAPVAPDFMIALGCVIRGGTPHFEYVCDAVTSGITRVQLDTAIPVGFGVLTVDNDAQAQERKGKGGEAAQAALFMWLNGKAVREGRSPRSSVGFGR